MRRKSHSTTSPEDDSFGIEIPKVKVEKLEVYGGDIFVSTFDETYVVGRYSPLPRVLKGGNIQRLSSGYFITSKGNKTYVWE